MKVAVIHTAFEDAPNTVAFVETPFAVVEEALEYAYRWTNNVTGSWSIKEKVINGEDNGDYNKDVTVMAPLTDGYGLRSTSVGDHMLVGNTKYIVASFGFEELV